MSDVVNEIGPLDINRIMSYLPHRYPFLLVDRVISLIPNQSVHAYKNVSYNEAFFQGHFPGVPVMPGVLIIEALAQASGLMVLSVFDKKRLEESIFLFSGIENAKFRRPVLAGDRLELHCELARQKRQLWKMRGTATVDGQIAVQAEMTAAISSKEHFS